MAMTFGTIALLPLFITFLGVREREEFTRRETLPILRSFRETLGNAPFWLFIAAYTLISLGYTILSSVLIYYAKYWLGNEKLFPVLMGIVMGVLVLSVPLWVLLSGRIGKKWAFIIGTVVLIIAALFFQASPRGMHISLYGIMAVAGLGTGAYFLFPYAMIPEIVDLDELKTGTRREGAYFGVFFFIFKVSIALAPFIAGYVLHEMGYVPDAEQTERALLGIRLLVGIIPLILFSMGIVFLLLFPLTKERYEAVSRELHDRSGV